MTNDLEFAIKQDIRNNPVVREVDLEQKREFVRLLGWAGLAVAMLLLSLWPRVSTRQMTYEIETKKKLLAKEQEDQRHLRMQLSYLTRPQEIRRRAIAELNMIDPPEDLFLPVEVVPSHTPASRAIVASIR